MAVVTSLIEDARAHFRRTRKAAPWKPVSIPTLEEQHAELEKLVGEMIRQLPLLRGEIDRLKRENAALREELGREREGEG